MLFQAQTEADWPALLCVIYQDRPIARSVIAEHGYRVGFKEEKREGLITLDAFS
jgi:hypothetical protein